MVREDILGGLRTALARRQTLRQAMMSFYNAGYIKQEIEEAAKAFQAERNQPIQAQFTQTSNQTAPIFKKSTSDEKDPNEKPKEVLSQTAKPVQLTQSVRPQTIQKVSAYGAPTQPVRPVPTTPQQPVQQITKQKTIQKVSAYGAPTQPVRPVPTTPQQPVQQLPATVKPKGKAIIFILLALLILLIGGLIAVFFFKKEILLFLG